MPSSFSPAVDTALFPPQPPPAFAAGAPRVLVFTDLSPASDRLLERLADWARARGARLLLAFHASGRSLPFDDPLARLAQRARRLARSFGIDASALGHPVLTPDDVRVLLPRCAIACLAVPVPARRRAWQPHDLLACLLHAHQVPVWVLDAQADPLAARSLCAVPVGPAGTQLLPWAVAVSRPDLPVELLHVADEPAFVADSPGLAEPAVREHALRQARVAAYRGLAQATQPWADGGVRFEHHVVPGPREDAIAAQLGERGAAVRVVVGVRAPTWRFWRRAPLAERLARRLGGEVLVVPLPGG
jgi:nucleotide-binding universal stress UspA family protein